MQFLEKNTWAPYNFYKKKKQVGGAGSLKLPLFPASTLSRPCGFFRRSGVIGFALQGEIAPHKLVLGYASEILKGLFGHFRINGQQIFQLKTVGRLMRPLQTGSLVGICNDA